MEAQIKKLVRMASEFAEEYGHNKGMVDISCTLGKKAVHMTEGAFKENFSETCVSRMRDPYCSDYSYEHFVEIEGVKFFCITRGGTL